MQPDVCDWVRGLAAQDGIPPEAIVCEPQKFRGCDATISIASRHGRGCPLQVCVSDNGRLIGVSIASLVETEFYEETAEAEALIRAVLTGCVEETAFVSDGKIQRAAIRWWFDGREHRARSWRWSGLRRRGEAAVTKFEPY